MKYHEEDADEEDAGEIFTDKTHQNDN